MVRSRTQAESTFGLGSIYIGTRAVGVDLDEENGLRIGRELLPRLRTHKLTSLQ